MRWKQVTITLYPLYSMAEISFHRFHMCKREKQTNIKMHSPAHILTPSLTSSSPLPIFFWSNYSSSSPRHYFFSLWFFVLFCIHKTNSKRSFLLYVDVMERASTPDYSSNWDWNQLFLNILVICYLKMLISCYNILIRDIFFSILLSCCCCRSRGFTLYLKFGTLCLHFCHAVFKHL